MIGLYAEKPGELARALFEGDSFDNFLLVRAQIRTEIASEFDGRLAEGPEPYISWGRFRSVLPALPTQPGDVLPSSCHIVLCLSRSKTAGFLNAVRSSFTPDQVGGLYLNIRLQEGRLSLTTGCSLTQFSPDRSLESAWDQRIRAFLLPYL